LCICGSNHPALQGLSEREWLALHAEIQAIQKEFGLSYKDSSHRLYLAEVARLKTLDRAHNAISSIRQRIDKILDHELIPPMTKMMNEGFDKDN
jgi:hypothetical protein